MLQQIASPCAMMNDIKEKKRAKKRLISGQQVSANVGEYIPNLIAMLTRKRRKTLVGYVVAESGPKRFTVMFYNGIAHDVASSSLRVCSSSVSLPPDERPLLSQMSVADSAALTALQSVAEEDADNIEEKDERGDPENEQSNEDEGGSEEEGQVAIDGQVTGDGLAIGSATGGVFIGNDLPTNDHEKLVDAHHKIAGMLRQTAQKDSFKWTVIAEHDVQDILEQRLVGVNKGC